MNTIPAAVLHALIRPGPRGAGDVVVKIKACSFCAID